MNTDIRAIVGSLVAPSMTWKAHIDNLTNYTDDKYDLGVLEKLVGSLSIQGSLKSIRSNTFTSCVIAKMPGDTSWDFTYSSISLEEIYLKVEAEKEHITRWIKRFMGNRPFILTPEISLENVRISHGHQSIDAQGNITPFCRYIHKEDSKSDIAITKQYAGKDHHYLTNLIECTVRFHFHLECETIDYYDLLSDSKTFRKFASNNLHMSKSPTGMETSIKLENTANYITKLNVVAPSSVVPFNRHLTDVPVYDKKSAYMRLKWMKVLKATTNIKNTDKKSLSDIRTLKSAIKKIKIDRNEKAAKRVAKIEKQKRLDKANEPLIRIYTVDTKQSVHNKISKSNSRLFEAVKIKNKTDANKKQRQFSAYNEAEPKKWVICNLPTYIINDAGPPTISAV